MSHPHIGSSFDDFLEEDGLLHEVEAVAIKRALVLRFREAMRSRNVTHSELARELGTSRSQVQRILDPEDKALTLTTLTATAAALGLRVRIEVDATA